MIDKSKYKSTAQEFLEIYDITNDLVILKSGTASLILEISAMNFGLLAEEEQDAVIYTYAALLNSLNYPIQIIIQSQTKDVTQYLNLLKEKERESVHSQRRERIARYREFVTNLIKERNVLDKKFFVVIPAMPIELELLSAESVIPGRDTFDVTKYEKTVLVDKALAILEPRRDHLISQFARIGLAAWQLSTQEIIRVFYTNYNPEASEGFEVSNTEEYQTPLVKASLVENLRAMDQSLTTNQQAQQFLNNNTELATEQQNPDENGLDQNQTQQPVAFEEPAENQDTNQAEVAEEMLREPNNQVETATPPHAINSVETPIPTQTTTQMTTQIESPTQPVETNQSQVQQPTQPNLPQNNSAAIQNPIVQKTSVEPAQNQPNNVASPATAFQENISDFSKIKQNLKTTSAPENQTSPPVNQAQQNQTNQPDPQQAVNNTLKEVGVFNQTQADTPAGSTDSTKPTNTINNPTTNSTTNQDTTPPPIPEIK